MRTSVAPSGATRRRLGPAAGLFFAAALPAGAATAPLDPARQYLVQGDAAVTVSGAHCCGATRFTGRFDAAYQVASTGAVTLARLGVVLDDADVTVTDGFLGLFTSTAHMRCASADSTTAFGALTSPTNLKFPAGTIPIGGLSSEERYGDGSCAPATIELSGRNNADANVLHDPAANRFALDTSFATTIEGDGYTLRVQLSGRFANRPPVAVLGVETPVATQPGCPAEWRWNGQMWETVVEANDAAGFKGTLRSTSSDPDGSWAHADVLGERWFLTRDTGARTHLGNGPRFGPVTFEWGPRHQLELLAADQQGAAAAVACTFRVVDTAPPVVTPPPPLVTGCTTSGGITPATSAQLRNFLATAHAADLGDPAPVALTPRLGAADVVSTTLFPADAAARTVTFRFRDRAGNLGQAGSTVTVVDYVKPTLAVTLTPAALPAAGKWYWINATLSAADDCGGTVALRLVSIVSNAPALDAADIFDASYGTDDRGFYLYERLAAPGVARIYKVTYEGRDAAGNVIRASATVTVS